MNIEDVQKDLSLFALGTGGLGSWLSETSDPEIFRRLSTISSQPIRKVQLNQLLVMGHEAPVSDGFFKYYWCDEPSYHPYNIKSLKYYVEDGVGFEEIKSLDVFKWGLLRIFIDCLLYWGSVRTGFRELRKLNYSQIESVFIAKSYKVDEIVGRGPFLPLEVISKDKRYLISEMACKSYEAKSGVPDLRGIVLSAFKKFKDGNSGSVRIGDLLADGVIHEDHASRQVELKFSADEVMDRVVDTEEELIESFDKLYREFNDSREKALRNTKLYLSMVSDLDVYVATSMRTRKDFRDMADRTEKIFSHQCLKDLVIRYFDPTLSAADGHENKGLIECLMVKCAKVLVYCAGDKESYGKDAEAAMALSLGKPVIFLCDHEQRSRFYKEVHPLSRLIHFDTGVPIGAIVTDREEDVSIILERIFKNKMEYDLLHDGDGYLRLKERITGSIVRLQTNDRLLNETFWNHYHG